MTQRIHPGGVGVAYVAHGVHGGLGVIDEVDEPSPVEKRQALPLDSVLEFMRLLWAVDHALRSTSKRMENALGVTGPQRLVVRIVGRQPGISAGRLAQILHLHSSTLTGILKRMERGGLLKRDADPLDARKALFTLTDTGRAQDVTLPGTVEGAVERVLARVSKDRLQGAQDVLTALAEELLIGNSISPLAPTGTAEDAVQEPEWVAPAPDDAWRDAEETSGNGGPVRRTATHGGVA